MPTEQDRFNEVLGEIAGQLLTAVEQSEYQGNDWQHVFFDLRSTADGGNQISKVRIRMSDGNLVGLKRPDGIWRLFKELWELRSKTLTNNWYGILISVTPDGDCKAEFNFDPDCMGDDTFFDD